MKTTIEVPIVYETFDEDLDKYHNETNTKIYDAPNGYKYYELDGLTLTFFRPSPVGLKYHIVICELDQNELNSRGILYDDVLKLNPTFTFTH